MCLAVPGRVVSTYGEGITRMGVVDVGGTERHVSLAMVPHVDVDDHVLVHTGYAIRLIDPDVVSDIHDAIDDIVVTDAQRGSKSSM